jgi:hypothetical protein
LHDRFVNLKEQTLQENDTKIKREQRLKPSQDVSAVAA